MSSLSNQLIFFGNNNLSNKRFSLREMSVLDSSPNNLQTIPISRGSGSSVVRTRTEARKIRLAGGYTFTNSTADADNVLIATEEVKRIFSKENRYLRTCPLSKIKVIDPCNSTTSWTGTGDAVSITTDSNDWQMSFDSQIPKSIKFTADVSVSASDFAKISRYGTNTDSVIDLSTVSDTGSFDFLVYMSDAYYVSSVFFTAGNRIRNLLLNSTSINSTDYTYSNTTRTNGATTTPNKAGTSALVTTTSTTSPLVRLPSVANNLTFSAGSYTCSIYIKAGGSGNATHFRLRHINTPDGTGSGALTAITSGISAGNGWYRHSYTRTVTGGSDNRFALYLLKSDDTSPSVGSTMEIGEVQIEYNSTATQYQEQGATVSTKYYSGTLTTNYEGKPFDNGWNYCSIKWGDSINGKTITETGTVDDNYIDLWEAQVTYSSSAEDFTCGLGGIFWANENFVRNYPCYLDGSVSFEPSWYLITDNVKNDFELELLNYTGYSIATHNIGLFNQTGITTLNQTKKVDLQGNLPALLTNSFKINTATNLNYLEYENLNTAEKISWTKTWSAGDNLVFNALNTKVEINGLPQDFSGKLPKNITGVNRLRMNIIQSGNTVNSQLVYNSENQTTANTLSAQSFSAPITGTLATAQVYVRMSDYYNINEYSTYTAYLYSNSGSLPSAILSTTTFTAPKSNFEWCTLTFNYSVVSGTTYWLVVPHEQVGGFTSRSYLWKYNSTSVVTGNRARYNGSWTAETSQDMTYILTFEPTPSTNIDWTCTYKPIYI